MMLAEMYRIMHEWMKLDLSTINVHTLEHLPSQYAPTRLLALTRYEGNLHDMWWHIVHQSNLLLTKLQQEHKIWMTTFHSFNTLAIRPSPKKLKSNKTKTNIPTTISINEGNNNNNNNNNKATSLSTSHLGSPVVLTSPYEIINITFVMCCAHFLLIQSFFLFSL
jgi:hypothetical protein